MSNGFIFDLQLFGGEVSLNQGKFTFTALGANGTVDLMDDAEPARKVGTLRLAANKYTLTLSDHALAKAVEFDVSALATGGKSVDVKGAAAFPYAAGTKFTVAEGKTFSLDTAFTADSGFSIADGGAVTVPGAITVAAGEITLANAAAGAKLTVNGAVYQLAKGETRATIKAASAAAADTFLRSGTVTIHGSNNGAADTVKVTNGTDTSTIATNDDDATIAVNGTTYTVSGLDDGKTITVDNVVYTYDKTEGILTFGYKRRIDIGTGGSFMATIKDTDDTPTNVIPLMGGRFTIPAAEDKTSTNLTSADGKIVYGTLKVDNDWDYTLTLGENPLPTGSPITFYLVKVLIGGESTLTIQGAEGFAYPAGTKFFTWDSIFSIDAAFAKDSGFSIANQGDVTAPGAITLLRGDNITLANAQNVKIDTSDSENKVTYAAAVTLDGTVVTLENGTTDTTVTLTDSDQTTATVVATTANDANGIVVTGLGKGTAVVANAAAGAKLTVNGAVYQLGKSETGATLKATSAVAEGTFLRSGTVTIYGSNSGDENTVKVTDASGTNSFTVTTDDTDATLAATERAYTISGLDSGKTVTIDSNAAVGSTASGVTGITLTGTDGKRHLLTAASTSAIVISGDGTCTQGALKLTKETGSIKAADGKAIEVTKGDVTATFNASTLTIDSSTLGDGDAVSYTDASGKRNTYTLKQDSDGTYTVMKKDNATGKRTVAAGVPQSSLQTVVTAGTASGIEWTDDAATTTAVPSMFNWADATAGYFTIGAESDLAKKTVQIKDQTAKNEDTAKIANVDKYFLKAEVADKAEDGSKTLTLTLQQLTLDSDGLLVLEDVEDPSAFMGTVQITAPTGAGLVYAKDESHDFTVQVTGIDYSGSALSGLDAADTVETAANATGTTVSVNGASYTVGGTAKVLVHATTDSSRIVSGDVAVASGATVTGTDGSVTAERGTAAVATFAKGAVTGVTSNGGYGDKVVVTGGKFAGTYEMITTTGVRKDTEGSCVYREISKEGENILAADSAWENNWTSLDNFNIASGKQKGYFVASYADGGTSSIDTTAAYTIPTDDVVSSRYIEVTTGKSNAITKLALVAFKADGSTKAVSSPKLADIAARIAITAKDELTFGGQTVKAAATDGTFTVNGTGLVTEGEVLVNSDAKTLKIADGSIVSSVKNSTVTVRVEGSAITSITGLDSGGSLNVTGKGGIVTTFTNKGGTIEKKVADAVVGSFSGDKDTDIYTAPIETYATIANASFSFGKGQVGYFAPGTDATIIAAYAKASKNTETDTVLVNMDKKTSNKIASITGTTAALTIEAGKKGLIFDRMTAAPDVDALTFETIGSGAVLTSLASYDKVEAVKNAKLSINGQSFVANADGTTFMADDSDDSYGASLVSGEVKLNAPTKSTLNSSVTVGGTYIYVTGKSLTVAASEGVGVTSIGGLAAGTTFTYGQGEDNTKYAVTTVNKQLSLVRAGSDTDKYDYISVASKSITADDLADSSKWTTDAVIDPSVLTVNLASARKLGYGSFVFDVTNTKDKVTATYTSAANAAQKTAGTVTTDDETNVVTYAAANLEDGESLTGQNVTAVASWQVNLGDGNDTVAAKGYNTIVTGAGNDSVKGGGKENWYSLGTGSDTISGYAKGSDTVVFDVAVGSMTSDNYSVDSRKNVTLKNGDDTVTLMNMAGSEVKLAIDVNGEATSAFFGTGVTKFTGYKTGAYYLGQSAGSSIRLATDNTLRTAKNGSGDYVRIDLSDTKRYANISVVNGKGSANRMALTAGANGATLTGGSFESVLKGGDGDDSLIGGSGADTFTFDGYAGADKVSGYATGKDTIQLAGGLDNYDIEGNDVKLYSGSTSDSVTLEKMANGKAVTIKDTNGDAASYYFGKEKSANTFTGKDGMKDVFLVNEDVMSQKKQTIKLFGTEDEIRIQLSGDYGDINTIEALVSHLGGKISSSEPNSKGICTSTLTVGNKTILSVTGVDLANGVDVSTSSNGVATITAKKYTT